MTVQGHSYDDNVGAPVNRNLIINGGMQVAQRGTSTASITTTGYYTADRWIQSMSALGTWTQTVVADAPTGSGFNNSLKVLCTTAAASPAAASYMLIAQNIEGYNVQHFLKGSASAKKFAVSFWVKSNVTGNFVLELNDTDNSRSCSAIYNIAASATWEKKTLIFPVDTTGAFTNDNSLSLEMNFFLDTGSNWESGTLNTVWATNTTANRVVGGASVASAVNNYWQVTGVQLEAGPVVTPFEFEPFETTYKKCLRYFQRYNYSEARDFPQFPVRIDTVNRPCVIMTYQRKRVSPTITVSDPTHFYAIPLTAAGISTPSAFQGTLVGTFLEFAQIYFTATFTGYTLAAIAIANANGYIDISAEL